MPSSSRRRRRVVDSDESGERVQTEEPHHEPQKRRRVEQDNSEAEDESEGNEHVTNGCANGTGASGPQASADGFHPGSIIRVKVENFITYENAEFLPGPNLNMIIGPNGTGKSSLVCAICLGLGYSPKHLGRATNVKEFVKHGKDVATIEIELQRLPDDRENYVIRVQIRKDQGTQKWWLNGKETALKNIQKLNRALKIQVDNLCQFLPQDRVVEFAACTPVDLLRETIRAAAPEQMLNWQETLKELHRDRKSVNEQSADNDDMLKNLESRQAGLQADVDRLHEREEIQTHVSELKVARMYSTYQEFRAAHNAAKDAKKEATSQLRRLQREAEPAVQRLEATDAQANNMDAVVHARRRAAKSAEQQADLLLEGIQKATEDAQAIENDIKAEENSMDTKKREVGKICSRMAQLEAKLKGTPPEFNAGEWNTRIRAKEHGMRELASEKQNVEVEIRKLKDQGRLLRNNLDKTKAETERLETKEGQQLAWLQREHRDVMKGFEWIQNNPDCFEKEVFGPPMLCCSVKDERYSDIVQSLLTRDEFLCFTTQSHADFQKLSHQFYDVMELSVTIRACAASRSQFVPPFGTAAAQQLGFDGFAIDYLEGPGPVLAMFCSERRLHMAGVSITPSSREQYDMIVQGEKLINWATGSTSYRVARRRELGSAAVSTTTRNIRPGQFWKEQPVDTEEKTRLSRKLAELTDEFEMLKQQNAELNDKKQAFADQESELYKEMQQLKANKSELQRAAQQWQAIPDILETEKRSWESHKQQMMDSKLKALERAQARNDALVEKAKRVIRYKDQMRAIMDAHEALTEAQIRLIETRSDVTGIRQRNIDITEQLEQLKGVVAEKEREVDSTKEQAVRLRNEIADKMQQDNELSARCSQLAENRTSEEIEAEIAAEEAKLELIHSVNPRVLREFEQRAREIGKIRERMENSSQKLKNLDHEIGRVRSKWEPELDGLISKINDAFSYNLEQINCAGEVRVHKDEEDFDRWALDIMVKFREDETLQKLDQHRQSGGERAVSTIFYLMALQSMAQSPFRVVDEINQGMDPRNERMVHERMVEIACREHTSQYFLITPKLLTGLRYDDKMRVLCIASGERMPDGHDDGQKFDFRRCLKVHKRLMAAA